MALVWLVGCAPWLTDEQVADRLDPDNDGVSHPEDCNSDRADAYPGATEVCDGIDNDCDGIIDGATSTDAVSWFLDVDGDGWGSGEGVRACAAPSVDHLTEDGDCDETRDSVHPGVAEVCNDGLDNDCDGGANTCVWSGTLQAETDAGLLGIGSTSLDRYGRDVVVAHLDDDGVADLIIGAEAYATSGGIGVFYGPVETSIHLADADARVSLGAVNPTQFGIAVANVGDLGGDGKNVIAVGAPASGSALHGSFYLLRNAAGLSGQGYADFWPHTSGDIQDQLGTAVSGLSDVNEDGMDELVVTAPGSDVGALDGGVVRIFRGPASSLAPTGAAAQITGPAFCQVGQSLARGDLDGDGVEDVVVGSRYCRPDGSAGGSVHVVSGDTTGLVALDDVASATIDGTVENQEFGYDVAVGDANGDGALDLWVAAPGAPSTVSPSDRVGAVYLFHGPLSGVLTSEMADVTIVGIQTYEEYGVGLEVLPDQNGDGMDEMIVGAPGHAESSFRAIAPSGAAYLFYSPFVDETRDDADAIFLGVFGTQGFGADIVAADLDADNVPELVIGGPPSWDDTGNVSIFWGVGL